ncbi:MAG: hypothetical protein K0S33_875 [Bacteroidetes bacterium]|jgi:hypothetical protein|nr:hypothetical protein [Bacteroidota bacterium]
MEKLNLAKQYKSYYSAKTKPELVEIESAQFLSITGKGDPSGPDFAACVEALYGTAYTIKFMFKAREKDFVVPALEGLWWFDEKKYSDLSMSEAPVKVPRSEWKYRLLIRLPDYVGKNETEQGIKTAFAKKKSEHIRKVEIHRMQEGKCVQMLHVGPFDREPETLEIMNGFISSNGFQQNGLHHEIYLSDFRKTVPEKLKTILREPVK